MSSFDSAFPTRWPAFELEETPQYFQIIDRDFDVVVDRYPKAQKIAAERMVNLLNDNPDLAREYEGRNLWVS